MNQDELLESYIISGKICKRSGRSKTLPSEHGELHHPELLFLGIDGGLDSYIWNEVQAGNLPNFARLLKRAARFTALRTAHPSITPSCWSSIITGATPEINGIIADTLQRGPRLTDKVTAYNGTHLKAERFWEGAVREGKTALISGIPLSAPNDLPGIRQCGGYCFYRATKPDSPKEFYDIPLQVWFFDLNKKPCAPLKHFPQTPSPASDLGDHKIRLEMVLDKEPGSNYRNITQFDWVLRADEEGFTLLLEEEEIKLLPESWGKPFFRDLPSDAGVLHIPFRFGCYQFEDGFLVISDVTGDLSDVCTPDMYKITQTLPPPPLDKAWTFWNNPVTARISLDSCDNQTDWQIEMLRQALSAERSDIVVTYFPNPDTVNHFFWNTFCGRIQATPDLKELAQDTYKEIYAIADRYLGFLLDEVADENTTILAVSDHGSLGHEAGNNINNVLEKAGFLQYDQNGMIDCTKSRAARISCGHIRINLQGRETDGIVPPEEYEQTVYEIIAALQDHLRGPDGRPYLAFAVRKEEAGFFGLGGENCGDIVYGLTAGYAAMTIHAEQIPSACSQYGAMLSMGYLAGPGVPEGITVNTPVRTVDLAPTLCDLLHYPMPAQHNGCSLRKLLKK